MKPRLVALDIDGTIIPPAHYGHDHAPSARLVAAVQRLTQAGVPVVLASGRMFPGSLRIARQLGLAGPVICQQGCSVHLLDGTMTHEFSIDRPLALEIVGYARELDLPYEWFNPLRYIVSAESEATDQYGIVSGITPECLPQPESADVTPTGVGIISPQPRASEIHRELVARHGDAAHFLDFPHVTVAVAPEANKGHALSLLCADLGIDRTQVLAVGDSVNDASMLAWAGTGLAMAHSDGYALDSADDVLADEDEALAALLDSLAV